jgi:hypothetical protein
MAAFVWRERLRVSVSEMSRAAALDCARDFGAFIERLFDGAFEGVNKAQIANTEIEWLFVHYAPVTFWLEGKPITDVQLAFMDEPPVAFTLPITRECFDTLPISLTQPWADAAQEANEYLANTFLSRERDLLARIKEIQAMVSPLTTIGSEPVPVNGQSSEPETKAI